MIKVENLSFIIGKKSLLHDVSLQVNAGEFVGVIGPNGSGKSTLLKNIYKIYEPTAGTIWIEKEKVTQMTNRAMAQKLAVVAQESGASFDFTVSEVVAMGRYPRKGMLETLDQEDERIVMTSLGQVGMESFSERSFLDLSGGEKQRVLIARALAQQTDIIILDEPTNHLDIGSQITALNLIKSSGKTVLTALHDLSTAFNYCDRVYLLDQGRLVASGNPTEVITDEAIFSLYGIQAEVFQHGRGTFIDYQAGGSVVPKETGDTPSPSLD